MKRKWGLVTLAAFGLAACNQAGTTGGDTTVMAPGDAGPGYCEGPPPMDPEQMSRWNELCMPEGSRGL